jgi:hypothetical protein
MKVFAKRNDELESTMKTHLIGGLDAFGIADDDYEQFLTKRGSWFLREIKKRVPQTFTGHAEESPA